MLHSRDVGTGEGAIVSPEFCQADTTISEMLSLESVVQEKEGLAADLHHPGPKQH